MSIIDYSFSCNLDLRNVISSSDIIYLLLKSFIYFYFFIA